MSANDFLDTLRTFDLEHQYPCLFGSGITTLDRLVQIDPSRVHTLGISGRDDIENLKALINELRAGMQMDEDDHFDQQQAARSTSHQRKRTEFVNFADSDEDSGIGRGRDGNHDGGGVIPRPGGQTRAPGRRPSSIYSHSNGSSSGIPRSGGGAGSSTMSPPLQAAHHGSSSQVFSESRTIGRHGLPPSGNSSGNSMLNRRQTLAPSSSSSHGFGLGRSNDNMGGGNGYDANKNGPGPLAQRSRTISNRPTTASARGPRTMTSNVNDILERSHNFAQAQRMAEDPDEDLEHVVRKTGQNGLVNHYGLPTRPTTAHTKRSGNDRRSLAPGASAPLGMRPKTAHRGARPEGAGLGMSSGREGMSNLNDKIRVCVRKRPLNHKERDKGEKDIVITASSRSLSVMEPKVKVDLTKYIEESRFIFDEVFDEHADNTQVYERTAKPLVEYIFTGGNATCFAYGQTGSGKTYTMMDVHNGLYIQAAEDIFHILKQPQNHNLQVFVMFYEIYLSNLHDLLNQRQKLFAREDANQNVVIQGVREVLVQSPADLMSVFEYGNNCRSTGSTGANSDSSRSHAILQILLKDTSGRKHTVRGKLNFIDLAGNERGADRGDKANKQTIMEGSEINKSLLALKECIRSLDLGKKHLPFRQSKLTQVLKDSFIGNSRACMVATISPNTANSENTLNTLRYSDRVKAIKSTNNTGDGQNAANDRNNDADEYYSNEIDEDYEDDSANRAYNHSPTSHYGASNGASSYMGSSHDAFREEDEYAESTAMDEEDEFASVSTTYQQNRQKQQQQEQKQQHYQSQTKPSNAYEHGGRSSFEDRLDYDIGEETTSLIDEQPSFLEEARHSLRSPRAYGSPAAKSFVASRMARSPPPGRGHVQAPNFSGSLVRNKRSVGDAHALNQQHQQQQQQIPQLNSRSSFEDDRNTVSDASNGASQSNARRLAGPLAGTNTANAGSSLIGGTRGLRPPAMARSGSVSYESSAAAIERDAAVRHQQSQSQTLRSNTYSNSTAASTDAYQATASSSPYTSALSVPSDDNSSSSKRGVAGQSNSGNNTRNVDGEDAIMTSPAEDRGDADDMFGGLRIADVESLVSQHRAEIRATTEACKEETTLIAAYTSFTYAHLAQQSRNRADAYNNQQQQRSRPNSWQQQTQNITDKYYLDTSTGEVTRLTDGLKFDSVDQAKMHEAMEYLEKLDDVLARKQQLVVDLRASIRKLVWNSSGQTN